MDTNDDRKQFSLSSEYKAPTEGGGAILEPTAQHWLSSGPTHNVHEMMCRILWLQYVLYTETV